MSGIAGTVDRLQGGDAGLACKVHNSIAVYAAMVSLFYSFWVTEAL